MCGSARQLGYLQNTETSRLHSWNSLLRVTSVE